MWYQPRLYNIQYRPECRTVYFVTFGESVGGKSTRRQVRRVIDVQTLRYAKYISIMRYQYIIMYDCKTK